jgi:hypothetical protein
MAARFKALRVRLRKSGDLGHLSFGGKESF